MRLQEIKRSYDLIASLGNACGPAAYLRKYNLRRFSMPLDWVVSLSLSDVNRLLKNRFDGFMELDNLQVVDGVAQFVENEIVQPVKSYFVKDIYYNIISVHDFPVLPNQVWTEKYPSYKEQLNFRVGRFIERIIESQSVLFIRWIANRSEVIELQSILSEIEKGEFHILVINPVNGIHGVVELDWEIDGVCSVIVPNRPEDVTGIWDYLLNEITLTDG